MTSRAARLTGPLRLPRPRPTARLRLTLLYGGLFTVAGAALLGFTYWLFDRGTNDGRRILPTGLPGHGIACLPRDLHCIRIARAWRAQHTFALHTLLAQSGIALAVMAALAFVLGWLVAGRVLRPVRTITAAARAISATSLHERLPVTGPDDEFSELASTLNDLLARLEASFTAQRHFVANASHELRTPLTLDRTLLQVALRNPGTTTGQWRATGQELLESGIPPNTSSRPCSPWPAAKGASATANLPTCPKPPRPACTPPLLRPGGRVPHADLAEPRARARRPRPDRAAGLSTSSTTRPPQHHGRHSPAQPPASRMVTPSSQWPTPAR